MRSLCVCLLPNTFKALVLCHDDAPVLCAACVSYSCMIYCWYHPTSLQAPSQGSTHCQLLIYGGNDCFACCKCIIHFNSVILILDLCVFCSSWHGWYVANKLVTSFSAVTKHYEVAFGLIYGRNESTREDTSSTDMIGADFDCCRWTLSTENHESTAPEPYSQGG